jgi:hypothetical protein
LSSSGWWRENAAIGTMETWHHRLVLDGYQVVEVQLEARNWWLDRIAD